MTTPKVPTKCESCKCVEPVNGFGGSRWLRCSLRNFYAASGDQSVIRSNLKRRPRWCPLYNGALIKA